MNEKKRKHWDMRDEEFIAYVERVRKEKGMENALITPKEQVVNALNLFLCHVETPHLFDSMVGLQMLLERLDLLDECYCAVDLKTWRFSIEFYDK